MKTSQKWGIIVGLTVILTLGVSTYDVFAGGPKHSFVAPPKNCRTVGAPLDGGILTVLLGGAGIAYFTRKKKKLE
jgi:hypothetical protein